MSWWNAKYKNDHGEYEITFASQKYEKAKAVEKVCCAVIDKKVNSPDDVEIVRHGRWIYDDVDSGDGTYAPYLDVHCDKCGFETGLEQGQYGWTYGEPFPANYCPNCGAKMDGDSHD